jgi:hypothetical protein
VVAVITLSSSALVRLEPEGRQSPRSNKSAATAPPIAAYFWKMGWRCMGFQTGRVSMFWVVIQWVLMSCLDAVLGLDVVFANWYQSYCCDDTDGCSPFLQGEYEGGGEDGEEGVDEGNGAVS